MQITRAATERDVADLIERPPRAHIAYARDGRIEAVPVVARHDGDGWLVRATQPLPPGRAMLLIDDGTTYFELRGVRYPGVLHDADPGQPEQRFEPEKTIGWHYGTMRERPEA